MITTRARALLAASASAASLALLTGCGSAASGGVDTTGSSDADTKVGHYTALVEDFNGLVTAIDEAPGDDWYADVAAVRDAVDYEFADGNTLREWTQEMEQDDAITQFCLTGPQSTYLAFTFDDGRATRTLGAGECDYEDGDVVLRMDANSVPNMTEAEGTLRADSKNLATALTMYATSTEDHSVPEQIDLAWVEENLTTLGEGTQIAEYAAADGEYRFCLTNSDQWATYDSAAGAITAIGAGECGHDPAKSGEDAAQAKVVEDVLKGNDLADQMTDALNSNPMLVAYDSEAIE